jgi:hypothetical protein
VADGDPDHDFHRNPGRHMIDFIRAWAIVPAAGCAVTGAALVILDNRWYSIGALMLQYILAALLGAVLLGPGVALVKIIGGALVCGMLLAAIRRGSSPGLVRPEPPSGYPTGWPFRLAAATLIIVAGWGLGQTGWLGLPGLAFPEALGSAFLLCLGLLQLGISEQPLKVGFGLLTAISGFEIAYAAIEPSLAVQALLVGVHLAIALVMSYIALVIAAAEPAAGIKP